MKDFLTGLAFLAIHILTWAALATDYSDGLLRLALFFWWAVSLFVLFASGLLIAVNHPIPATNTHPIQKWSNRACIVTTTIMFVWHGHIAIAIMLLVTGLFLYIVKDLNKEEAADSGAA